MSTAEPQHPADPVTDDTGRCQLSAAASLEELPAPDVVVIGGSLLDEDPDERVVHWLHQVHPTTGHAVNSWNDGTRYTEQRVVEHGKVITAAGMSADIDMALTLLARMHGPQLAQMVQLGIEYDPQPPFDAGPPSKAPRRTRSTGTHAGMDCPQAERRERTWPQSRAKTHRPARCRR